MKKFIPDTQILALALGNLKKAEQAYAPQAGDIRRSRERLIRALVTGAFYIPTVVRQELCKWLESESASGDQKANFEDLRRLLGVFELEREKRVTESLWIEQQCSMYRCALVLACRDSEDDSAWRAEAKAFLRDYKASRIEKRLRQAEKQLRAKGYREIEKEALCIDALLESFAYDKPGEIKEAFKKLRQLQQELAEYLPGIELIRLVAGSGAVLITNDFNYCYLAAAQKKLGFIQARIDWDYRAVKHAPSPSGPNK